MTNVLTIVSSGTESRLTFDALVTHPSAIELALITNRQGRAVKLADLLADVTAEAGKLTLTASADGYTASLPLKEASESGFLWFAGDDGPLTSEQGGPFRFLIPNAAECKTAVLDSCANVKHVDRIEVE